MKSFWLAFLLGVLIVTCSPGNERIVVAAGTTLVDSGLLDDVAAVYESNNPGIEVSVVAEPTALALELGRQGAADLLIVHAPRQEAEFVAEDNSRMSLPLFESSFVLAGPDELASRFEGLDVVAAFASIASDGLTFVSRADGSGTYEQEQAIWAELGFNPSGEDWYVETGSGMGPTLLVADQRRALILSEYGAFSAARSTVDLVRFAIAGPELVNPYTGYVPVDAPNASGAVRFLTWLTSSAGMSVVEEVNLVRFGEIVYAPVAG